MSFDPLSPTKFKTPSELDKEIILPTSKERTDLSKLFSSNINKEEENSITFSPSNPKMKLQERKIEVIDEEASPLKKSKTEEFKIPFPTPFSMRLPTPDMRSYSLIPPNNFSNFNTGTSLLNSKPVPQTPKKGSPSQRFSPYQSSERSETTSPGFSTPKFIPATPKKGSPFQSSSPYKIQYEEFENGTFLSFYSISTLGKGSYSKVYILNPGQTAIRNDLPNNELVIKAFHGEIKTGFIERPLNEYLNNSINNYQAVLNLGLPVATIYNVQTASKDRYVLQRKIPNEIKCQDPEHILQAQNFFTLSVTNDVVMDLQPQNLRVDDNGTVILIDFVEDMEDENLILIDKALKAWANKVGSQAEARNVLFQLTSGFLNKSQYSFYTTDWLESVLKR